MTDILIEFSNSRLLPPSIVLFAGHSIDSLIPFNSFICEPSEPPVGLRPSEAYKINIAKSEPYKFLQIRVNSPLQASVPVLSMELEYDDTPVKKSKIKKALSYDSPYKKDSTTINSKSVAIIGLEFSGKPYSTIRGTGESTFAHRVTSRRHQHQFFISVKPLYKISSRHIPVVIGQHRQRDA